MSQSFKIDFTKSELEKKKRLFNAVKSKLPDKGEKLKQQIDDLEKQLSGLTVDSEETHVGTKEKINNENEDQSNKLQAKPSSETTKFVNPALKNKDHSQKDVSTEVKNELQTQSSSETAKLVNTALKIKDVSQKNVSTEDKKSSFNLDKAVSFKELADKNATRSDNGNCQSPSFSGWRDPTRKIQLTEAKPLVEPTAKKGLGFHGSSKPLLQVNEESVKKIQHSLVTYPDNLLEESDPELLKTTLMTHQRRALAWMMWREEQDPSGGILADDMGLGKTLTMISLVLKQNEKENYLVPVTEKNCTKGTLIVCLASIIHQWKEEISKHSTHDAVDVLLYHGNNRDRDPKHMMRYNIVLTTYNLIMAERKAHIDNRYKSPLFALKWERIVLDEAHTIKNHNSQTAQAIFSLNSYRKWAVTGTPIHNVFKDMYSLVRFLQFSPFDDPKKFKKLTDDVSESSEKRKKLLVKSIVLRRTKEEADEKGKPLVEMKKKYLSTIYIELSKEEKEIYDKLNEKVTKKVDLYFHNHKKLKSSNLLVLLLRLQQCCNHTSLLGKDVEDDDISLDISEALTSLTLDNTDSETSSSESSLDLSLSGIPNEHSNDIAVKSSKIKKLFEQLEKISTASDNKDKCVIVSQWVSMLEIIAYHLKQENITCYLIAGSTKAQDRQKYVEQFNSTEDVKVMLLSLKAGGVGLNLTGANHLFLMDLHWNPALEMQASDRIHRVGQKKAATIYKFICKDTIEEKIKALQDEKRSIASDALHGIKQSTKGMTLEDFKTLFYVKT